MTRADLTEAIYQKIGFTKKESTKIFEMVLGLIKDTLGKGEKVKISGFGVFAVREKKARLGRNPRTGEGIEISARRVLTFRTSHVLKTRLNGR